VMMTGGRTGPVSVTGGPDSSVVGVSMVCYGVVVIVTEPGESLRSSSLHR
jgi:hypothetical protein